MGIFYARAIAVVLLVIVFVTWLYRLLFTLNERRINKIEAHERAVGFANSVISQHDADAVKLPTEKFVSSELFNATRNEVRAKALEIAQEYAKNNFDYVNSDVINTRLIELGYPPLGKYAGGFFRNRKLFATTGLFDRSKMPSAHGRTIQFYRYVGQQAN